MSRPPRVPVWIPEDQPVTYFLTICVKGRAKVLANEQTIRALHEIEIFFQEKDLWIIHSWVAMPDHIHLLISPLRDRCRPVGHASAAIKKKIKKFVEGEWSWQPGCFDRLLRRSESAQSKWEYMRMNPVRGGLVKRPEDWPYQRGF